ncbi:esterase, partial [Rhizobiaceae sp. 2RAB30]
PLTDSRLGLGDTIVSATAGAAQTVGTAAGLVVAAPAAIVDQNTRQNYARHVEELVGTPEQARQSSQVKASTASAASRSSD